MASDVCIVNAAIGGNYAAGQRRLIDSLGQMGYRGGGSFWDAWPDGHGMDELNRYNIKAAVMERALLAPSQHGRILIWLDCTCVAVANLQPLIDRIEANGYYLASSGYSAAQTCTDEQLTAAGVTRDEAMTIPDAATGCIGIDTANPRANAFLHDWIDWARRGLFAGNRVHDVRDSQDYRFLHARQDQSAATLLAHRHRMSLSALGGLTAYWPPTPTTVIAYKGIQ